MLNLLWILRAPIFVVLLPGIAFIYTNQFLDIFRDLALNPIKSWSEIVFFVIALVLFACLAARGSYRALVQSKFTPLDAVTWALGTMLIPPLFACLAMTRAAIQVPAHGEEYATGLNALFSFGIIGILGIAALGCHIVSRWHDGKLPMPLVSPWLFTDTEKLDSLAAASIAAVFLAVPFFGGATLVSASTALGPIAIVLLSMSFYAVALCGLTAFYDRTGWPVISSFIAVAVISYWIDWNDNHIIRTFDNNAEPKKLSTEFPRWYASRRALVPESRPVPVFVIAAQGGGLYAARHAATALANIQDKCPAFGQHVFAISGVSGGSVGGSVFAASMKELSPQVKQLSCEPNSKRPFSNYVDSFLEKDFLSPVLWLWLIPDFLHQLLPFPTTENFDRARGLEHALEQAQPGGFIASKVISDWNSVEAVPALFLNTSRVGTGQQLHVAPLQRLVDQNKNSLLTSYAKGIDMRVSTAAVLSARFPFVTPAGRLDATGEFGDKIKFSLVDGGYSDNSGLQTARAIVRQINRIAIRHGFKIQISLLAFDDSGSVLYPFFHRNLVKHGPEADVGLSREQFAGYVRQSACISEASDYSGVFSPFVALNSSRSFRPTQEREGFLSLMRIMRTQSTIPSSSSSTSRSLSPIRLFLLPAPLTDSCQTLPLGWRLSKLSHDRIAELRIRDAITCKELSSGKFTRKIKQTLDKFGDKVYALHDKILHCTLLRNLREKFRS